MQILKTRTAIKVNNIAEVVANRNKIKTTPFVFESTGDNYYLYEGERISEEKMKAMFPLQLKPVAPKGANYGRTKNWVFGEKSY